MIFFEPYVPLNFSIVRSDPQPVSNTATSSERTKPYPEIVHIDVNHNNFVTQVGSYWWGKLEMYMCVRACSARQTVISTRRHQTHTPRCPCWVFVLASDSGYLLPLFGLLPLLCCFFSLRGRFPYFLGVLVCFLFLFFFLFFESSLFQCMYVSGLLARVFWACPIQYPRWCHGIALSITPFTP